MARKKKTTDENITNEVNNTTSSSKTNEPEYCSICGRHRDDVKLLFKSDVSSEMSICNDCVEQLHMLNMSIDAELRGDTHNMNPDYDENGEENESDDYTVKYDDINIMTPHEIKAHLDEYIIGQDEAKKSLAVAVYNHYKRVKENRRIEAIEHSKNENLKETLKNVVKIDKSNTILCGKSGVGKTALVRTISQILDVPFTIVDATVFTEAGYVGEDVESILTRLLQACDYDVKKAEMGIVYVDEADKLSRKGKNPSITRDVNGEGVQQALLKMLEGTDVLVPPQGGRKHPEAQMINMNTQNILFIFGGAFDGIEDIIKRRLNTKTVGFKTANMNDEIDEEDIIKHITHQDLRSYGYIPELIGRLPVLVYLESLKKDQLKQILTEPKNAIIKQYKKLMELDGIELNITDDVYNYIVDKCMENETGARGLRAITEKVMHQYMYDAPSMKETGKVINIDIDYIKSYVDSKYVETSSKNGDEKREDADVKKNTKRKKTGAI